MNTSFVLARHFLLLALLLTACEKAAPPATIIPTAAVPTSTATIVPPTNTRVPTLPTNSPRPTNVPRPTNTPKPTESTWDLSNLGSIAFYDIASYGIVMMNPDGSGRQILVPNTSFDIDDASGFSWSPDGQSLAYSSQSWADIYIYSMKAAKSTNITNMAGKFESGPDWSPDGKQIAFSGNLLSKKFNIYVMNVDGSHIEQLTDCPDVCIDPDWSPDGAYIAYRDRYDINVMSADGSGARRLTHGGINTYPAWSPDGSQIAFTRSDGFEEPTFLYLVNQDGSGIRGLTNSSVRPNRFSWSPDGRYIVFCNFEPYAALWLLDVESGAVKQIDDRNSYSPEWSTISSTPVNPDDIKPLADCTSGWSRLQAGGQARVMGDVGSSPLRVRSEPEMGNNIITMLPAGKVVDVLEGPVCADGLVFWKVHSAIIPGGTGWIAEGNRTEYWLEPYKP